MRVLVIGGTGTIGAAVVEALRDEHEVLTASRSAGDHRVDISSPDSIRALFEAVGRLDGVVCCAGQGAWGPLESLSDEEFGRALASKLMGQVNLVRFGAGSLADGGAMVLTSGVLAHEPTPGSAAVSLVNAGVEAFAHAAALELPRGIRVNVVSPPWVSETLASMGRDADAGLPAARVAATYREALLGEHDGEVLDARTIP